MKRVCTQLMVVIGLFVSSTHFAKAVPDRFAPPPPIHRHGAPAPLLAAGIPSFIALGGGAFLVRMVRRRKSEKDDAAKENI
jgi:hypothetical protein